MLLDGRFDAVGVQYMQLSHEKGAAALGQELSAFGWALYDLDGEDEYLFVLIPQGEREAFEAFCKQQGQYCRLMKQPRCGWGDHAREQAPGAVMPCEEYILEDEYDYFFNSMAGDFAAGEWKPRGGENWQNGCVADLAPAPAPGDPGQEPAGAVQPYLFPEAGRLRGGQERRQRHWPGSGWEKSGQPELV